jgi:phosphate transport system protein
MTREIFEHELKHQQDELLVMGCLVENAVRSAVAALKNHDLESARTIAASDQRINEKRYEIEQACLTLIATQQPMARDLRLLAAILEIITDLERIADYAKGICRITILLGREPFPIPMDDISIMADTGLGMLQRALDAFIARDSQDAYDIPADDDVVDALYNKVYHDTLMWMIADPTIADRANYLIWAAHNLERLADRVTNICERIVFMVRGEIGEFDGRVDKKNCA